VGGWQATARALSGASVASAPPPSAPVPRCRSRAPLALRPPLTARRSVGRLPACPHGALRRNRADLRPFGRWCGRAALQAARAPRCRDRRVGCAGPLWRRSVGRLGVGRRDCPGVGHRQARGGAAPARDPPAGPAARPAAVRVARAPDVAPVAAAWRRSTSWSTRAAACRGACGGAQTRGSSSPRPTTVRWCARPPGRRGGAGCAAAWACSCEHVPRASVGPAAPCTPAGPAGWLLCGSFAAPAACGREGGAEGARGGQLLWTAPFGRRPVDIAAAARGGAGHSGAGEGRGCVHFAGGVAVCASHVAQGAGALDVFLWATRERLYTVTPEDMDAVGAIHGRCRPRPRRSRRRCRRVTHARVP